MNSTVRWNQTDFFKAKLGPVSLFLDLTFTTQKDYKTFCLLLSITNLLQMFIQEFQNLFVFTAISEHNLLNCWTFLVSKVLFLYNANSLYFRLALYLGEFYYISSTSTKFKTKVSHFNISLNITKKCKQTETLFPRHVFVFSLDSPIEMFDWYSRSCLAYLIVKVFMFCFKPYIYNLS